MGRPLDKPLPIYTLASAAEAVAAIRWLRREARDPDRDALPVEVTDDLDVAAALAYVEQHRRVSASVRAAELEHRAMLIQYLHQRAAADYDRRLLGLLRAGYQIGAHPVTYGSPVGLPSRQAVYGRRTLLTRKLGAAADRHVDEGRAREWLDEHAAQIYQLADVLVDARDDVADLVTGPARDEVLHCVDQVGMLMLSRRVSQDLCTAVALAVHLLRPGAAAPVDDPVLADRLDAGRRLLWPRT
jgi:hypothetical protein